MCPVITRNQSRFDHKSCVPERSRSYHRVWWALQGWGITNSWRLRRVWEAEQAESNDWYHYPNGRVYYTPLRKHMRELVDAIIADAVAKGFRATRCRPGGKHKPGTRLIDPAALEHCPDYMEDEGGSDCRQRCQECGTKTPWYCPGCASLDAWILLPRQRQDLHEGQSQETV